MLHSFYFQLSLVALVLVCGLAIVKGAPAERAGGTLIVLTWLVTLIAAASTSHDRFPAIGFLISDAVLATGLLFLALRYGSWWLGGAMLLQAVELGMQSAYLAADRADLGLSGPELLTAKRWLVLGGNLASCAMLLVLLTATILGMLKRRRHS